MAKRLTFAAVKETLREHRVTIFRTAIDGEVRVRLDESPVRHGYYTTDLEDALATGIAMRAEANRKARGQSVPFVDVSNITDGDGVTRRLSNAVRVF